MYKNDCKSEEYRGCNIDWYYDENAESPREWDNVGHMICFSRNYSLGDKHNYNSDTALQQLAFELASYDDIWELLTSPLDGSHDAFVEFKEYTSEELAEMGADCQPETKGRARFYDPGWKEYTYEWDCDSLDEMKEVIIDQIDYDSISNDDAMKLIEKYAVIMPISVYEHSGMTIWYGHPNDRWDSGCVGFGYMTKKEVIEGWPSTTNEDNWKEEAAKHMETEMSVYRAYVEGDVYGFVVTDEEGEEIDSCWGYYGDKDVDEQTKECRDTIDNYLAKREEDRIREEKAEEARRIEEACNFWNCVP